MIQIDANSTIAPDVSPAASPGVVLPIARAPGSLAPSGPISNRCPIGIPCGSACISADRVCRIGQSVEPRGQACGRGYIALDKTCRIDQAPPATAQASNTSSWSSATPSTPDSASWGAPFFSGATRGGTGTGHGRNVPQTNQGSSGSPTVSVRGYTRSDGTQVRPHERSAPSQGEGRGGRR